MEISELKPLKLIKIQIYYINSTEDSTTIQNFINATSSTPRKQRQDRLRQLSRRSRLGKQNEAGFIAAERLLQDQSENKELNAVSVVVQIDSS